jgi:allantoicase
MALQVSRNMTKSVTEYYIDLGERQPCGIDENLLIDGRSMNSTDGLDTSRTESSPDDIRYID